MIIVFLVIALIVFGPGKLPEIGRAIGKGIGEFKSAMSVQDKQIPARQPILGVSER